MTLDDNFESHLTKTQCESIRRSIRQGIKDLEAGRYQDYDADGLRALAKQWAAASSRKISKHREKRGIK